MRKTRLLLLLVPLFLIGFFFFRGKVERYSTINYTSTPFPSEWVGTGEGKTKLLHEDWVAVHGEPYTPRDQLKSPTCVGQAVATAADFLAAVEIHSLKQSERAPPAKFSASVIYGLSRQEIANLGFDELGGSFNFWAVKAIQQYGVVPRLNYPLIGIDLRNYDVPLSIIYGMKGVPTSLENIGKLHRVKTYIPINSYEEIRDSMTNGCPVVIGSDQGFGKEICYRDKDGFLRPHKYRICGGKWQHSMCCIGVCDQGRKGVLVINSWGSDWIKGPKRFDSDPEGSFWIDASIVTKMCAQKDTFAIMDLEGWYSYNIWSLK